MKRIISLMLVLVMSVACVFTLASCSHEHTYNTEWASDETHHWHAASCDHADEMSEYAEHSFGEDDLCTVCGMERGHVHTYEEKWSVDQTKHWRNATCEHTSQKGDYGLHNIGEDGLCTVCSYNSKIADLNAVVNMYANSSPTRIVANSQQVTGLVTLKGNYDLTVSSEGEYDIAILKTSQQEVRSVADGGRDPEIKEMITLEESITHYHEALGVRKVNMSTNTPGAWNANGESLIPEGGAISIDLLAAPVSNCSYADNKLTLLVPAASTEKVLGIAIEADVEVAIETDGAVIIGISLSYTLPEVVIAEEVVDPTTGKTEMHEEVREETTVNIDVTYTYDIETITLD